MKLEVTGHQGKGKLQPQVIMEPGATVTVERGRDSHGEGVAPPGVNWLHPSQGHTGPCHVCTCRPRRQGFQQDTDQNRRHSSFGDNSTLWTLSAAAR